MCVELNRHIDWLSMKRLSQKVAIITGAAKGLGEAEARRFAEEGAQVILTDVDTENGERIAAEIGDQAQFYKHNVCDENQWKTLIDDVLKTHGKIDILINNAGVVEAGTIETQTTEEFRFVMNVSVEGTFFGCKYVIPAMKENGGGSIINMASIASLRGAPNVIAYSAAKGAVESMSRSIAAHSANNKLGIRCNSVHPSAIMTPMIKSMPEKMAKARLRETTTNQDMSKSGIIGHPNDIVGAVLFLASDESKFISGTQIVIDNGLLSLTGNMSAD